MSVECCPAGANTIRDCAHDPNRKWIEGNNECVYVRFCPWCGTKVAREFTAYVASGLPNYLTVIDIQERLAKTNVFPSFDWAQSRRLELITGIEVNQADLAKQMLLGVRSADAVLLVLEGGRGAHVELGIACQQNKPVVVYSPDPVRDIAFYKLPNCRIVRDLDEAIRLTAELAK